ncbi:hypothetical protein GN244_ATG13179 [Phytophthora infestans]|uniref:Uncharacterized protein n=1 Tax=Phytophthora infestans TaxID=4787 RepID=A0A833W9N5_PHYIN|nr:hypothetical protein GN244_ATG13179 [Phytophthora infestans]
MEVDKALAAFVHRWKMKGGSAAHEADHVQPYEDALTAQVCQPSRDHYRHCCAAHCKDGGNGMRNLVLQDSIDDMPKLVHEMRWGTASV